MEHPIAARTLFSMFMVVLLLSPLLILPSDSRELPTHTGVGGTASPRSFASLARRTEFAPPSPTANSNDAPGKG
ncbi:Tetratricopeptide repeat protein [Musa troglodytarum]|uniref:Tetratricopeptide repeat protein n=1 Tax=Musa troglodytarum TaxID=320322 RepID=A0A9E7I0X9_9LILI|nr:Tetratricopeptide repeat protein [Musa troglodytarum]